MKKYNGAVFFDFDGTLVDEKEHIYIPTDETKRSIEKLKSNGYMTCIATGRARCYIPKTGIDFDCYVTSNGACVSVDGEYILNDTMDSADLSELIDFFDKNDYGYIIENDTECYYSSTNQDSFIRMMENFNISMDCFLPFDGRADRISANKMMFTYNDDKSFCELKERFGHRYNITRHRSNPSGDLVKKQTNKAQGIRAVAKAFDLSLSDTYAFGDGENDVEMISAAGNGIVMGRHAKALEALPAYITETVINEGVTLALKKFDLI